MTEEDTDDYRVIFSNDSDVRGSDRPGTIVITPDNDDWNDFGNRIHANISIYTRLKSGIEFRKIRMSAFLAFMPTPTNQTDVRMIPSLKGSDESYFSQEDLPEFFTMLPDVSAYRRMVSELEPSEARVVLQAVHDIVEAGESSSPPPWLRRATDGVVFQTAFLRNSESYFAWKNAGPILHGLEYEEIGRLSEKLEIDFHLAGRPNWHEIRIRFALHDAVLPKRFAILIGKNGVGKSQSLGRIVKAAMKGSSELTDGDGHRPMFNRLLAFSATTVSSSVFPAEQRRRSRVWYRRFSLNHPGSGRRKQSTADLIIQLARTTERIGNLSRLDIFLNGLRTIDGYGALGLLSPENDEGAVRIVDIMHGSEQTRLERFAAIDSRKEPVRMAEGRTYSLSSGEMAFVRFTALASLYVENSSLLLFDEPETHLHPDFISQFVTILNTLLEQTGSAAIIATHSIYFVREAFEDQVIVMRSGPGQRISAERATLQTFGADVGAISYFVFDEDEPSRLASLVEEKIAGTSGSWEEVFEKYKNDLSLELLNEIRATLEDRKLDAGDS